MIHWIIAGFCWPRNTFSGGSDKRYQKGYSGKHSAKPNICIKERLIDNRHHCQCDFHVASLSVCKDVAPNWGLSQPSPWPMAAKRSPASSVSSGYTNSFIIKVSRWSMLSIISFNTTAFEYIFILCVFCMNWSNDVVKKTKWSNSRCAKNARWRQIVMMHVT